jgi:hypothetical protein
LAPRVYPRQSPARISIPGETTPSRQDFARLALDALHSACVEANLDPRGVRLIRLFASAVYHLPAIDAVARISRHSSPRSLTRAVTSLQVTQWLANVDFPTVQPLPITQPIATGECIVTFWRYLPQDGPSPTTADLGLLLKRLHRIPPPPIALPAYEPLRSVTQAIESSLAITEDERQWLQVHCQRLENAYQGLDFELPSGMIHGDAYLGNLLQGRTGALLADWDSVSIGPREMDLVPTLQAQRFGLPPDQRENFVAAYGHDIRSWTGYPILRDVREVSTLTALLRNGHVDRVSLRELRRRIYSLQTGDRRVWNSF